MTTEAFAIAEPYAKAVFENAKANSQLDDWQVVMQSLSDFVSIEPIQQLLDHPQRSLSLFKSLLIDFDAKTCQRADRLLALLYEYKRLQLLPLIAKLFYQKKRTFENTLVVDVQSAFLLSATQKKRLEALLEKSYQQKIELVIHYCRELIGGVKITIHDELFDGSLQGQLNRIRAQLNDGNS